jgi:DNA-binding MarR family transcriptional regulator
MNTNKELFAKSHLVLSFIRGIFILTEDDVRKNLKKYGMTVTGFRTLWILYYEEKMNMTEHAYISQTNISNIYRQLTKLKDQNFVVIENGDDARIKEVSLTENGRKFVQDVLSKNVKATNLQFISILKTIPEDDLEKFIEVASILSSELIGKRFTDWAVKAANKIRNL